MDAIFVGGKYHGMILNEEQLQQVSNGKFTENLTELRSKGVLVHRAELDNQPKVDGYLGPMWDGGRLRYETQQIYNELSC